MRIAGSGLGRGSPRGGPALASEGGPNIYDAGSAADALVPAGGGFRAGAGWTSALIGAGLVVAGRHRA